MANNETNKKITDTNKKVAKKSVSKETINKIETKSAKTTVTKKVDSESKSPYKKEREPKPIEKEEVKTIVKDEKISSTFEKIVILVAVSLVFSMLGFFIGNNHNNTKQFYTDTKELDIFIEQYNKIIDEYYADVNKEDLIKGAIKGMLSTLDGYSQVIDDNSNNFTITLEGSYEGLGIEIINNEDGQIEVYHIYDDTPASKSGIELGDIITKVNDTNLENTATIDFINIISNLKDMQLTILRNSEEIKIELKKEKIELKSVSHEMLENKIGYIKVDLFANNTTKQFKKALEDLEKQKMKSLIIDLRDNTGGHLSTVKDMLSLFLDSSHIIYQTQTKTETIKYNSEGNKNKDYKIVILQNRASASASEIMSSALKEQLNAYIIGTNSYGKGTVQQLQDIEGIAQYKFTTKKWLTSKGVWVEGIGVEPDLKVELDRKYILNPTKENDTQYKAAINYLKKN